jgi:hypothetical protein
LERLTVTESELLSGLDVHDALLVRCANREISFEELVAPYDDYYVRCALDGHESPLPEQDLLARHAARIRPHARIWQEVLCHVTSEELASAPGAREAGFFGPNVAVQKLRAIAADAGLLDG